MADHAPRGDDPAHLGHLPVGAGPLCRRRPRDSRVLRSADRPIRDEYLIVDGGRLAGTGAHSYSAEPGARDSSGPLRPWWQISSMMAIVVSGMEEGQTADRLPSHVVGATKPIWSARSLADHDS